MRSLTGTLVAALLMLGLATRGWSQVQTYTNEKRSGNSNLGTNVRDRVTIASDSVVQQRDLDVQAFGTQSTVLSSDLESRRLPDGTHYQRASVRAGGWTFLLGASFSGRLWHHTISGGTIYPWGIPVSYQISISISASRSLSVSTQDCDLRVSDALGLGVSLGVAAGIGIPGILWAGVEGSATILGGKISFDVTHHASGYTDAAIRPTVGSWVSLSLFVACPWWKLTWTFAKWTIWEYTLFEWYLWAW